MACSGKVVFVEDSRPAQLPSSHHGHRRLTLKQVRREVHRGFVLTCDKRRNAASWFLPRWSDAVLRAHPAISPLGRMRLREDIRARNTQVVGTEQHCERVARSITTPSEGRNMTYIIWHYTTPLLCLKLSHGVRVAATLCHSAPRIYRSTTELLSLCRSSKG
jgi:hypothetical protein